MTASIEPNSPGTGGERESLKRGAIITLNYSEHSFLPAGNDKKIQISTIESDEKTSPSSDENLPSSETPRIYIYIYSKPKMLSSRLSPFSRTMVTARAIVYSNYGEPNDVIQLHKYQLPQPKGSEVILKAVAHPINPSDINQIQGVYPSRPELTTALGTAEPSAVGGNEGLFSVVEAGPDVSNFKKGDWCIPKGVNSGTWTSHTMATEKSLISIPKSVPRNQAATLSVNTCTAYQMLTMYAKLGKGDWFIQNGGNSAVGKAAVQIGKKLGFKSISIIRDRPNVEELIKELKGLGATHVITEEQNEDRKFGKTVKEWLEGKEIRLGLNCVGGSNCTAMARKLGSDAHLLTYGGMSKKPVSLPTTLFIFKNLISRGFWITENSKKDPESKMETINAVVGLIEDGALKDTPVSENAVSDGLSDEEFLALYKESIAKSAKAKQLIVYE